MSREFPRSAQPCLLTLARECSYARVIAPWSSSQSPVMLALPAHLCVKRGRYGMIHFKTAQLTSHIESLCQCQLFEGSPPNLFEPPFPSVLHIGHHVVQESMPIHLPFLPLSTNLLQARYASWIPALMAEGGHATGKRISTDRARLDCSEAYMAGEAE